MSAVRPRRISAASCVSLRRRWRASREAMTTKAAIVVTAAIATAAATIVVAAPVHPIPPVPSAPACVAWTHTGALNIDQDNGLILQLDNWLGNSAGTAEHNARLLHTNGTPVLVGGGQFQSPQQGQATGGNTGNKFDLTVVFPPGLGDVTNHYTGAIDDMGTVSGTTVNSKGVTNQFVVQEHFTCANQGAPAPVPDSQKPVHCSAGGYTLPPGSDCSKTPNPNPPAPPPVTNAIKANFDPPGLKKVTLRVENSSNLTAACHYEAKANTNNPLVKKDTTRDFTVPANGKDAEEFDGAPTGTTYTVTITCKDASGKQTQDIGDQNLTLKW